MSNVAKKFDILATLSILHNYFDSLTKLFFLSPAKILDLSAKPFFPYKNSAQYRYKNNFVELNYRNYL